jgi:hypothetical protein
MKHLKSQFTKAALIAAIAASSFALTSAPASAAVVCNRWNECWHVRNAYVYPPRLGIVVRDERWVARHHAYRWRAAHEGRGYWRGGVWHRW